eukprot:4141237-Pleurochrysis_carterae.AAC.1
MRRQQDCRRKMDVKRHRRVPPRHELPHRQSPCCTATRRRRALHSSAAKPCELSMAVATPVQPDAAPQPTAPDSAPEAPVDAPSRPQHFQRGLGSFPLRSSALLVTRRHAPHNVATDGARGHGCALAASAVSTDPRTRKQAMAEDSDGWSTAERAEIANHKANG